MRVTARGATVTSLSPYEDDAEEVRRSWAGFGSETGRKRREKERRKVAASFLVFFFLCLFFFQRIFTKGKNKKNKIRSILIYQNNYIINTNLVSLFIGLTRN